MHPLLARQLRKVFRGAAPAELAPLLASIEAAYLAADDERHQLERSLLLASDELYERNRLLEHELEERKRLEVELQHAEKLRAVGQLASGVAHEINTPVQFIADSLEFLVDAFADVQPILAADSTAVPELAFLRAEIPRALQRCRDGSARVATIVRALKGFARNDAETQELADLHAAIHNTLIVVAGELRYVADVELDLACNRLVRCHIGEIQQVLLNLLVNAGHAIADGGSGGRGVIRVATRDDGPDVVITIADTGGGIPEAIRPRIFEPFFTTKPVGQGTGQGLSLVYAMIVERHEGQITFDSVVGDGTTFTIRIPADGRACTPRPRRLSEARP